jgi:Spy/CpxP family protein refolding chaperone
MGCWRRSRRRTAHWSAALLAKPTAYISTAIRAKSHGSPVNTVSEVRWVSNTFPSAFVTSFYRALQHRILTLAQIARPNKQESKPHMSTLRTKFAAWTAVAALGAASLFAAETSAAGGPGGLHRHGRMGSFLSSYLNLTPAQQAQQKTIFQNARQSAKPIRQQLRQTRQSLRAAIQANNTAQIQQLAASEGSQVGQLAAIHATARAQAYQVLTPAQQQELAKLQQAHQAARRAHSTGAAN